MRDGRLAWWWAISRLTRSMNRVAAVFLNLVVAALAGVAVPLALRWAGRDPAHGSSVMLTFVTDGAGFFMFLGLATLFLV